MLHLNKQATAIIFIQVKVKAKVWNNIETVEEKKMHYIYRIKMKSWFIRKEQKQIEENHKLKG